MSDDTPAKSFAELTGEERGKLYAAMQKSKKEEKKAYETKDETNDKSPRRRTVK